MSTNDGSKCRVVVNTSLNTAMRRLKTFYPVLSHLVDVKSVMDDRIFGPRESFLILLGYLGAPVPLDGTPFSTYCDLITSGLKDQVFIDDKNEEQGLLSSPEGDNELLGIPYSMNEILGRQTTSGSNNFYNVGRLPFITAKYYFNSVRLRSLDKKIFSM